VHLPEPASPAEVRALRDALVSLSPTVQAAEAERLAADAFEGSRELAQAYRVVRPARLHNMLVNVRLKRRGLCYHWAGDLQARLQTLEMNSLQLRWGVAHGGTFREHNSVVVTARAQPFETGVVLDPWRHGGALFWSPVQADSWPWREGALNPLPGHGQGRQ
jgi:hypothetical protein